MAAITESLQIEPGEIVPFCKSDELEPGEIRPRYVPLQLQVSAHANVSYRRKILVPMQTCWGKKIQTQAGVSVKKHDASSQNFHQTLSKGKDVKVKSLQEVPMEWKNTLEKERETFAVKFKRQSRKIRDLEIKDKHQQNEIKKQTYATAAAEDMWKKTNEEKEALRAMMKSMEREGCKISRLLKIKEAKITTLVPKKEKLEADDEVSDLKAECEKLADQMRIKEPSTEKINDLEDQVTCYKVAHEKATTKIKRNAQIINELEDQVAYYKCAHEKAAKKLTKASQMKESLTQQSDLWRSKFTKIEQELAEKETICQRTNKEQTALAKKIKNLKIKCSRRGKIIETEKQAHGEMQKDNKNLKKALKKLKKERDLLLQENNFLKEENHNLRYYGGVVGSLRRVKRFFDRLADRLSS